MAKRSKRYMARVAVLQELYAQAIGGQPIAVEHHVDREYQQILFSGITQTRAHLEEQIGAQLSHSSFEDVMLIDQFILLIGAYELEYRVDVPWRVVVNEGVELAKEYGSDDGYKMVNAILDHLALTPGSEKGCEKQH